MYSPQFRKLLKNIYEQAFEDTLFFEEFEQEYLLYFGFKNKTLINLYRKNIYIYLRGSLFTTKQNITNSHPIELQ